MNIIDEIQKKEIELQNYIYQRQALEIQINEIESALNELKDKEYGYDLIANIMIKKPKQEIEKKLNEKREILHFKIESLKKYEQKIKENLDTLRNKYKKGE